MAFDNAAIARRYLDDVWTKGNLAVVDELVTPNGISHDPISGDVQGVAALKAQVTEYRTAFPDLRFTVTDVLVAGDRVCVRWTATGTHKAPLMGIPPTGKMHSVDGITVAQITQGKLVEQWPVWDTLKFAQNLGLVPPLPAPQPGRTETREARPH
jgi:steroid delta-isomerase-like uncharacterized protein